MDAIHYAKIADKLMQFRGMVPNWDHVHTDHARILIENLNLAIENLLNEIDQFARADDLGWLK